ncbi:hypothetical protein DFJ74DRAFT_660888 [Hyaloraphidium curvatum]|nr:hypothetical protein DFJ74DRAFT_660888 [Hyaloraphidium curvatum]
MQTPAQTKGRRRDSGSDTSGRASTPGSAQPRRWSTEPGPLPKSIHQAAREAWNQARHQIPPPEAEDSDDDSSAIPKPFTELLNRVALRDLSEYIFALGQDFRALRGSQLGSAKVPQFLVTSEGPSGKLDPRKWTLLIERNPEASNRDIDRAIRKRRPVYKYLMECVGTGACPNQEDAKCPMMIGIYVFANDPGRAVIYAKDFHDAPDNEKRRSSGLLRSLAFDYFLRSGSTPALFLLDNEAAVTKWGGIPDGTLKSIARQARRAMFGPASLSVLRKLAAERPQNVYLVGLEEGSESIGASFSYAFTDTVGLVFAIVYGSIVGIDSSWRRKNIQKLPITGLVAFDVVGRRAKPLAFLFSTNIRRPTLKRFLEWFLARVISFARGLLEHQDESTWPALLRGRRPQVEAAAMDWRPRCMTLDKSYAELGALQDVFGVGQGTFYRLCYFHIKQAFQRRAGKSREGKKKQPIAAVDEEDAIPDSIIPRNVRTATAEKFRQLCAEAKDEDAWASGKKTFLERTVPDLVEKAASDRTVEVKKQIVASQSIYVEKDWFNDTWAPLVADYLLPDDVDLGDCFTNNHVEIVWKVIDGVILRGNFHIATAIVKLDRFWAYSLLTDHRGHVHPKVAEASEEGTRLWERGHVKSTQQDGVFEVRRSDGSVAVVDMSELRRPCSVSSCRLGSNPHRCKHWFAADLFQHSGPFSTWEEEARKPQTDLQFDADEVEEGEDEADEGGDADPEPQHTSEGGDAMEEDSVEEAPVEDASVEEAPVEDASVEEPMEEDLFNNAPVNKGPEAEFEPAHGEEGGFSPSLGAVEDDGGGEEGGEDEEATNIESTNSRQNPGRPSNKPKALQKGRKNPGPTNSGRSSDDDTTAPKKARRSDNSATRSLEANAPANPSRSRNPKTQETPASSTPNTPNTPATTFALPSTPMSSPIKAKRPASYSKDPELHPSVYAWADAIAAILPAVYRAIYPDDPPSLLGPLIAKDSDVAGAFLNYAQNGEFPPSPDLNRARDMLAYEVAESLRDRSTTTTFKAAAGVLFAYVGRSFGVRAQCNHETDSSPTKLSMRNLPVLDIAAGEWSLWKGAMRAAWHRLPPRRGACRGSCGEGDFSLLGNIPVPLLVFAIEAALDIPSTINIGGTEWHWVATLYGNNKRGAARWIGPDGKVWQWNGSQIYPFLDAATNEPAVWEGLTAEERFKMGGRGRAELLFFCRKV